LEDPTFHRSQRKPLLSNLPKARDGSKQQESLRAVFDELEDSIINVSSSNISTTAQDFVQASSNPIHTATQDVTASVYVSTFEESVKGFAESSRVLRKVLDEVRTLHPFIGVAVLAFKAMVTLELKRRDNQKIIALQFKMQDMMSILVQ